MVLLPWLLHSSDITDLLLFLFVSNALVTGGQAIVQLSLYIWHLKWIKDILQMKQSKKSVFRVATFDEFKSVLHDHEIETSTKFVYIKGTSTFSQGKVNLKSAKRLHWDERIPFFNFGYRSYDCHQGADKNIYQKRKYAALRDTKQAMHNIPTKRYKPHQTKKTGCPARIIITRIVSLPSFEIEQLSKHCKKKMSNTIKKKLHDNEDIGGEELYIFNLPVAEDHKNHTHLQNKRGKVPLDERVYFKIEELAEAGLTRVKDFRKRIEDFVLYELRETDVQSRRFCPTVPVIRTIIQTVQNNMIKMVVDGANDIEEMHSILDEVNSVIVDDHNLIQGNEVIEYKEDVEEVYERVEDMHEEVYESEQHCEVTSDRVIVSCNETMELIQTSMLTADVATLLHVNSYLNETLNILKSKENSDRMKNSLVNNNDDTRHNDRVVIVIDESANGTKHEQTYVINCDNVCVISHEEIV